ncbi:MAG: SDR family oxidoreductase [Clostridia bacterium]|nr:SDR family oxidoreductase [Clostridia bacterium]
MKAAIVTGASSGIGQEISRLLMEQGMRVYGFGRTFPKEKEQGNTLFVPVVCELTDLHRVRETVEDIRKKDEICLLVNNAGVGYFGLHEELNPQKIHEMVTVNVEIPMVLTQMLLRDLKRCGGAVVNISSVTAKQNNPHGCAYGATKAALGSFSGSLFAEARKYGVRIAAIHPDMTATQFYRNADFEQAEETDCRLDPTEVAQAVLWILQQRQGLNVTEIVLQPQKHRIRRKK